MLSTVLVILTLGHADGPHVSFSATGSPQACAAKGDALASVLEGAGYRIGARRCVATDLKFEPYDHGAKHADAAYRITLSADPDQNGMIEPIARLSDCTAAPDADPAIWCAVSAQGVAAD